LLSVPKPETLNPCYRRMLAVGTGRYTSTVYRFSPKEGTSYRIHGTHIQFSRGTWGSLLVNYHGDGAYLFDLEGAHEGGEARERMGAEMEGGGGQGLFVGGGRWGISGVRPIEYHGKGTGSRRRRVLTSGMAERAYSEAVSWICHLVVGFLQLKEVASTTPVTRLHGKPESPTPNPLPLRLSNLNPEPRTVNRES